MAGYAGGSSNGVMRGPLLVRGPSGAVVGFGQTGRLLSGDCCGRF